MQNVKQYIENVNESAKFIKNAAGRKPEALILTGTGLGDFINFDGEHKTVNYADIPNFPASTVKSHKGQFAFGEIAGVFCAVMLGRFHLYEGYTPAEVVYPIRVMQVLGVKTMLVTNAAGGITARIATGEVMVINDHINLTGENPLAGAYSEHWGDMFVDMLGAYDENLQKAAIEAYRRAFNDELKSGVYIGLKGPSFETPAEIAFFKTAGADAVGFSTVMEVIAARQAKMRVFGMSAITNSHVPHNRTSAGLNDIIDIANECAPKMQAAVKGVLAAIKQ